MNTSSLHRIGLTEDQILTYKCLLENGSLTPPQLADITEESRTSAYMSLKKMEELGLATRDAASKKLVYTVVSPARLDQLLIEQEEVIQAARTELQTQLPDLLNVYYTHAAKPNVRYYEGADTLQHIYQDRIDTGENAYVVRTPSDKDFYDDTLYDYMNRLSEAGLTTYGLAPSKPSGGVWSKKDDKKLKREMSPYNPGQYTAPVEISIYGNKVAFVTFGKKVTASVIDSKQIATAMQELFMMAKAGLAPEEIAAPAPPATKKPNVRKAVAKPVAKTKTTRTAAAPVRKPAKRKK